MKDGVNWFSYANQNPLRFTDPTGLRATDEDQEEQNKSDEAAKKSEREERQQNYWEARQKAAEAQQEAAKIRRRAEVSDAGYIAPTDSRRIVSGVGVRSDAKPKEHTGLDMGAIIKGVKGDPLYAIADSTVVRNGLTGSLSSRLEIKLPNGNTAVYQHGDFPDLKKDDILKQGDTVGTMSDVGSPDNVHLHFEIRKDGKFVIKANDAIDPLPLLPGGYYFE